MPTSRHKNPVPKKIKVSWESEEIPFVVYNFNTIQLFLDQLSQMIEAAKSPIGFDTETRPRKGFEGFDKAGLTSQISDIRLLQFYSEDYPTGLIYDCGLEEYEGLENYDLCNAFIEVIEDAHLVGHNMLFDCQQLQKYWPNILPVNMHCTMITYQLLLQLETPFPKSKKQGLADVVKRFLDVDLSKDMQASAWGASKLSDEQIEYAARDVIAVDKLFRCLKHGIKDNNLLPLYELEIEAQHMVSQMHCTGLDIDVKKHNKLSKDWSNKKVVKENECLVALNSETEPKDRFDFLTEGTKFEYSQDVVDLLENFESADFFFGDDSIYSQIFDMKEKFCTKNPKDRTFGTALRRMLKNIEQLHITPSSAKKVSNWLEEKLPNEIVYGDWCPNDYEIEFESWLKTKKAQQQGAKFEMLGSWPRGKSGNLSTSADTFTEHLEGRDVGDETLQEKVEKILEFKTYSKLDSTYGQGLKKRIYKVGDTHKIYPNFRNTETDTGRLSSNDPNVQNQPARGVGAVLKEIFVAPVGYRMLVADYGQIELRVAAYMSGDIAMIKAYEDSGDLHTKTAAEQMGLSYAEFLKLPKDVFDLNRYRAKAINFGLLFGAGARTLQKYARISYGVIITLEEAELSWNTWRATYPGYVEWQQETQLHAKATGYAKTLLGRTRLMPENYYTTSMNTRVQGTAAEINKKGGINIIRGFEENNLDARMNCNVHDEYVMVCKDSDVDCAKAVIEVSMEEALLWAFPEASLSKLVEVGVGDNWKEAK